MEDLIKKLEKLIELSKALKIPTSPGVPKNSVIPTSPGVPKNSAIPKNPVPKLPKISLPGTPTQGGGGKPTNLPGPSPTSNKDPKKIAQQIKNAEKLKQTMPMLKSEEEIEKGLKSAIASGLVGASMLMGGGGKAEAAPAPVKAPIAQVQQAPAKAPTRAPEMQADTSTGNQLSGKSEKGGSSTFNTKTYGPYQIKTMYEPRVGDGHKSYNLTHAVSWNGTPSPEHMAAVAKEYNIEPKNLQGLNANPGHEDGGGKVDIDGNWTRGKPSGDTYLKSTGVERRSNAKGEPSGNLFEKPPVQKAK